MTKAQKRQHKTMIANRRRTILELSMFGKAKKRENLCVILGGVSQAGKH